MFQPGLHDEVETYVGYLQTQIDSLREAAYGLTEEQARLTPCRSALSIGGLLKHATFVLDGRARRADLGGAVPTPKQFAEHAQAFMASFALAQGETLAGTLAEFDRAGAAFVTDVRRTDPAARTVEPPAPWDNRPDPSPAYERFQLVHIIEELARHAGHADIIREEIDGAQAMSLHFAATGKPGNRFVQPWRPEQP